MIKFFNVTDEEEYEDVSENIQDESLEELGQIAVDILETSTEMIILAPVA
jgi:hypothetical protein